MGQVQSHPVWGIVFKPWEDEPVYHRLGSTRLHTACGRPVGTTTPMLPFKHVTKFGRPCRGCFDA